MKKKPIYNIPQAQVVRIETGSMIATSLPITEDTTEDDARMSKKRQQPWDGLWE